MSKKHDRNVRYFAMARVNAEVAIDAISRCASSLTHLEIGPSNELARSAADVARRKLNELDQELNKLERLVCS